MKTVISTSAAGLLVGLMSISAAWAQQSDFSRYQVIIDRNLFGEPIPEPQPVGPVQPVQPPQPSFEKTYRLCGITEERDGTWVMMVDVGVNPNKSGYSKVGDEIFDGVKILEADVVGGRVVLKKGDEEKSLTMDQPAAGAHAVVPALGRLPGVPAPGYLRTPPPPASAPTVNPSPVAPSSLSIAEKLRQRREALERVRAAATSPPPPAVVAPTNAIPEMSHHERMKKLREYNLELIRAKGAKGPPIPIQLTPEEDEQLVKEGVLAPQPAAPSPQE